MSAPGYVEQSRQLTAARKEFGWLGAGSQTVQRKLARAQPGSNRRRRLKTAIGRLKAREGDRRKD